MDTYKMPIIKTKEAPILFLLDILRLHISFCGRARMTTSANRLMEAAGM